MPILDLLVGSTLLYLFYCITNNANKTTKLGMDLISKNQMTSDVNDLQMILKKT